MKRTDHKKKLHKKNFIKRKEKYKWIVLQHGKNLSSTKH